MPLMALTATASARVQDDIVRQLRLRDPLRLASSFNRPNIHYEGVHWLHNAPACDGAPQSPEMGRGQAGQGLPWGQALSSCMLGPPSL